MKTRHLCSALLFPRLIAVALVGTAFITGTLFTGTAQAVTIVDGTSPGYVLNGSFESGSDGSPVDWLGNDNSTALAADLGIDLDMIYRNNLATPSDGADYTVIGQRAEGTIYGIYLDTGYNLAVGDTFELSFYQGNHASSGAGDILQWHLFTTTTNSDSGVVEDTIASGSVSVNTSTTLQLESFSSIGSVTGASGGERLFLAFTPDIPAAGVPSFFALDQVNLIVTAAPPAPIPEPGSALLLSLGLISGCLARRRGKKAAQALTQ